MARTHSPLTPAYAAPDLSARRRGICRALSFPAMALIALALACSLLFLESPAPLHADTRLDLCLRDGEIMPSTMPTATVLARGMPNRLALPLVGREANFASSPFGLSETPFGTVNVCLTDLVHGQSITGQVGSGASKNVWAGVLRITVNGAPHYGFCTDLHNPIGTGQCFNAPTGVSRPQVACSMFYYPATTPLTPVAPATNANQEGAARQAAVWYFSDDFTTTGPTAIATRARAIIDDINVKYASGLCPEVGMPSLTIDPIAAVNALTPDGSGGFLASSHTFTVTARVGGQLLAGRPLTVTTTFGTFDGGGTVANGLTDANGRAQFTITSSITGVAQIAASALLTNLVNVRFETGPTVQKLLVSWNQPYSVTGNATKEWIADGVNVQKFHDLNMNGVQDEGEPSITWTVRWRELPDGVFQNQGLGIDGSHTFPVDPTKEYEVCERMPLGSAWIRTTPSECYGPLRAGDAVKFGNTNLRALVVFKFHDLNGNGIWDGGEPPLPLWGFGVLEFSDGVWKQRGTGVTADDGSKGFTGLAVAPHQVIEALQTGWLTSTASTQYFTFTNQILTGTLTFGNLRPASVTVTKTWSDGGIPAGNQPFDLCLERTGGALPARIVAPLANGVMMASAGPQWRFCATDVTSPVQITNLWPGAWRVEETDLTGWFVSGESTLTLSAGSTATVALVNERPVISLTARPEIEQPYTWEITKSVAPPALDLTIPATGTFTYTVAVERTTAPRQNPSISGSVIVTNTLGETLDMHIILITVDGVNADRWECATAAPLAAGASRTCAYTVSGLTVPPTVRGLLATVSFVRGGSDQVLMAESAVVDFAFAVPVPVNDTITVTDTQRTGSWSFTSTGQTTYTTVGDCDNIEYNEQGTGSKIIANTVTISETGQTSSTNVTVNCTLTQRLDGYKVIDWSSTPPDPGRTFTICAQGPSFPTGTEPGACQTVDWNGGAFTWGNVIPGDYTVREQTPGGDWVPVPPVDVTVRPGQSAEAVVHNRYLPPTSTPTVTPTPTDTPTNTPTPPTTLTPQPTPTPTVTPTFTPLPTAIPPIPSPGAVVARKIVDWGVQAADINQTFTLCLTGNGITPQTPGACQVIDFAGGEVAWTGLAPGQYVVTEQGLDPNVWQVTGSGAQIVVVSNGTVGVEISNVNTVPTDDPPVGEPGMPWYIRLPMILLGLDE